MKRGQDASIWSMRFIHVSSCELPARNCRLAIIAEQDEQSHESFENAIMRRIRRGIWGQHVYLHDLREGWAIRDWFSDYGKIQTSAAISWTTWYFDAFLCIFHCADPIHLANIQAFADHAATVLTLHDMIQMIQLLIWWSKSVEAGQVCFAWGRHHDLVRAHFGPSISYRGGSCGLPPPGIRDRMRHHRSRRSPRW